MSIQMTRRQTVDMLKNRANNIVNELGFLQNDVLNGKTPLAVVFKSRTHVVAVFDTETVDLYTEREFQIYDDGIYSFSSLLNTEKLAYEVLDEQEKKYTMTEFIDILFAFGYGVGNL